MLDIILILFVNKVIGFDLVSYKMLKVIFFIIVKLFILLFNRLFVDNIFLCFWKIVYVIFLFKKDDLLLVFNYRLVFLLLCVSKIMERIVFKYVYNYFYRNNLFY